MAKGKKKLKAVIKSHEKWYVDHIAINLQRLGFLTIVKPLGKKWLLYC
jgi:hypothetical protein